jgi:hypothetical protein
VLEDNPVVLFVVILLAIAAMVFLLIFGASAIGFGGA